MHRGFSGKTCVVVDRPSHRIVRRGAGPEPGGKSNQPSLQEQRAEADRHT